MNRRSNTRVFLFLGFLAAGLPASARPAEPADQAPVFGEQIEVRVVNVEAVVTDKDGNRVTGLQPSDFTLKVDGKSAPVEYFTEVVGRQAVEGPGPGGPAAAGPSVVPGEVVGTYYLVFVDDYFSQAPQRNQVIDHLSGQLARLGPDDRMAVVAFDGARLDMLSTWSNSQRDLSRAFSDARARPARGPLRVTELGEMLRNESFTAATTDPFQDGTSNPLAGRLIHQGLSLQEKAYGQTLARQVEAEVSAVVGAMRATSGVPGRKVLLLLSGGWPFSLQSYIRGDQDPSMSRDLPEGEKLYRPLTSTANLLGYTIYPVDLPGSQAESADASTFGSAGSGSRFRELEVEGALTFVAKETGGRALLNSGRDDAFQVAEEDTRSYYWLGFSPTWERNDKRHQVDVGVLKPGLTVRSRNSFLDMSKEAGVSMMLESALLFGNLPDAIEMPVRIGKVTAGKRGTVEIPLTLGLPVNALTTVQVNGKYHAKLELRVAATDDQGNRSDVPSIPLELSSDREPRPGGFVKYETKITIAGKPKHLVLATYDPLSGKVATAEADVPAQ